MSSMRGNCLIVLSGAIEGVSTQSFIQAFNLTHSTFNVQLTSPNARPIEFVEQDETSRKWLAELRTKSYSQPISLESIDASRYGAVLIPASPGAVSDLANNQDLKQILNHFIEEKKLICAVGLGVTALASAKKDKSWTFSKYSMTGASVKELARTTYFGSLSVIPEDFVKENGGQFSCSEPDAVYVVVDRHVVTGQNEQSTLTAVQNLILLYNQKFPRPGNAR